MKEYLLCTYTRPPTLRTRSSNSKPEIMSQSISTTNKHQFSTLNGVNHHLDQCNIITLYVPAPAVVILNTAVGPAPTDVEASTVKL